MAPTAVFDVFVDGVREDFDLLVDGVKEGSTVIKSLFPTNSSIIDLTKGRGR